MSKVCREVAAGRDALQEEERDEQVVHRSEAACLEALAVEELGRQPNGENGLFECVPVERFLVVESRRPPNSQLLLCQLRKYLEENAEQHGAIPQVLELRARLATNLGTPRKQLDLADGRAVLHSTVETVGANPMTGDGTAMTDGKGAAPAGGGGKQRASHYRLAAPATTHTQHTQVVAASSARRPAPRCPPHAVPKHST